MTKFSALADDVRSEDDAPEWQQWMQYMATARGKSSDLDRCVALRRLAHSLRVTRWSADDMLRDGHQFPDKRLPLGKVYY